MCCLAIAEGLWPRWRPLNYFNCRNSSGIKLYEIWLVATDKQQIGPSPHFSPHPHPAWPFYYHQNTRQRLLRWNSIENRWAEWMIFHEVDIVTAFPPKNARVSQFHHLWLEYTRSCVVDVPHRDACLCAFEIMHQKSRSHQYIYLGVLMVHIGSMSWFKFSLQTLPHNLQRGYLKFLFPFRFNVILITDFPNCLASQVSPVGYSCMCI